MENNNKHCEHQVVGIALVVEKIGKGSKLVFKYPLEPPTTDQSSSKNYSSKNNNNSNSNINSNSNSNSNINSSKNKGNNNLDKRNSGLRKTNASTNTSTNIDINTNTNSNTNSNTTSVTTTATKTATSTNIFFRLEARVLEKLFRTKPPLCGQPVSLNIEGTIFCCRSVLLNHPHTHHRDDMSINTHTNTISTITTTTTNTTTSTSTSNNPNSSEPTSTSTSTTVDGLVLFSIIVALKPIYHDHTNKMYTKLRPLERTHSHSYSHRKFNSHPNNNNNNSSNNNNNNNNDNYRVNERASLHLPAVRRIHLTLSRLCKILQREEKRCLYVSRQVSHLLAVSSKINDMNAEAETNTKSSSTATTSNSGGTATTSGSTTDAGNNSNNNTNTSNNTMDVNQTEGEKGIPSSSTSSQLVNNNNKTMNTTYSNNPMMSDNPISYSIDVMYSTTTTTTTTTTAKTGIKNHNNGTGTSTNNDNNKQQQQILENEQQRERLDFMLAASPPPTLTTTSLNKGKTNSDSGGIDENQITHTQYKECIPIYGNLAVELAQIYYALSDTNNCDTADNSIRPSPDSLLSGGDGIVYINLHIAIQVEAAASAKSSRSNIPLPFLPPSTTLPINSVSSFPYLRSYHTLLFHPVSAAELLRHKMKHTSTKVGSSKESSVFTPRTSSPHPPGDNPTLRHIEKLLMVADDPFKSMSDMALDTALPLPIIIEAATSLLESGVCIAIPVMTTSTKFGCSNTAVERMASLRLEFAQQFGHHLPIFMVVSALTSTINTTSTTTNSNITTKKSNGQITRESSVKELYDDDDDEKEKKSFLSIGQVITYSKAVISRTYHRDHRDHHHQSDDEDEVESSSGVNQQQEDSFENNIPQVFIMLTHRILETVRSGRIPPGFAVSASSYDINVNNTNHSQIVKNALISMTIWLRSRSIIIEQKEYLASIFFNIKNSESFSTNKSPSNIEEEEKKPFVFRDNEDFFSRFKAS